MHSNLWVCMGCQVWGLARFGAPQVEFIMQVQLMVVWPGLNLVGTRLRMVHAIMLGVHKFVKAPTAGICAGFIHLDWQISAHACSASHCF